MGLRRREHGGRHEGLGRRRVCPSCATTAPPARSSERASDPARRGYRVSLAGETSTARLRSAAWPTSTSTCSWSAAGSPAPASRSTPRPGACAPRWSSAHDFASGTSSKSSKLVHGGIRYLQQSEVGLVYEALAERQMLRKTAPHLVRVLPFLLPVFTRDGLLPRRLARLLGTTMWMYDLTGGLRIGKLHKRVSKEEALQLHADAAGRTHRGVVRLLRRADRRRPPHARDRADRRRLRRRGRELHEPRRARQGHRRPRADAHASWPTADDRRPRVGRGERDRRVVRRRARARRGHPSRRRSGPPRACTSPCRGRSCRTRSRS